MPKYNNNIKITVIEKKYCEKGDYFSYNKDALGEAVGKLNMAGIRAYLYLSHNAKDKEWVYNSTAYANWLGMSRHSADTSFKDSGVDNLIKFGYMRETEIPGTYEFSEFPKQEWLDEIENKKKSQIVTKKSEVMTQKSQTPTEISVKDWRF